MSIAVSSLASMRATAAPMTALALVLGLTVGATPAAAQAATGEMNWRHCQDLDHDRQVDACTALIEAGGAIDGDRRPRP